MKRGTRSQHRVRRINTLTLKNRMKRSHSFLSSSAPKFQQEITVKFMEILIMIKLFHWKTHSYATHKATDELYSKLNENKISYLNTGLLIANRLSAPFDSAILLPYANKNDGAFKKYINYEYFFKSTLNSLVPGVLYPDATISTSRLINVIFRNVSIEHIKKYGY